MLGDRTGAVAVAAPVVAVVVVVVVVVVVGVTVGAGGDEADEEETAAAANKVDTFDPGLDTMVVVTGARRSVRRMPSVPSALRESR